jgi:NAD(P)-dependent dehydrogenase (short-subunit alcohol dehydrogenase family)
VTAPFPAAVIIGAGGGIGGALVTALPKRSDHDMIHALSRQIVVDAPPGVRRGVIDVTDEETIRQAAAAVEGPVNLVIVATGMLHEAGRGPERALRDLDPAALARIFAVNTIGPALVLKHFAPLLSRDRRSVFALLSARVGSISDNRSGGWYGYRASKAALNMIVRSAAIELSRSRPQSICVGIHPGTVDTGLSKPFQANVPADKLFTPEYAAEQLLQVIHGLATGDTGNCFGWDGKVIEP